MSSPLRKTVERAAPPAGPDRSRLETIYPRALAQHENILVLKRRSAVRADDRQPAPQPGTGENLLPEDTVGVALSGGGIRSATFCLGVFRTLSRLKLVRQIDFLSTVSGGGYFGSFLGGLFTRTHTGQGEPSCRYVEGTLQELRSEPVQWLRENGRYMSPNGSGDLLQAGAVILRNWVALLLVLSTFVVTTFTGTVLLGTYVPEAATALSSRITSISFGPLAQGVFPTVNGIVPSPFFIPVLFLWVVGVIPLGWGFWFTQRGRGGWWPVATASFILIASVVYQDRYPLLKLLAVEAVLALAYWLAALAWSFRVSRASEPLPGPRPAEEPDTKTRRPSDGNPVPIPRLARSKLSRMLSITLWGSVGLAVFGLVDTAGHELAKVRLDGGTVPASVLGTGGMLSLLAVLQKAAQWVGQSRDRRLGVKPQLLASLIALAAVVALLVGLNATVHKLGGEAYQSVAARPEDIAATRTLLGWMAGLGLLLTLAIAYSPAFLNLSSHHSLYGARLTRAYLGASNSRRHQSATPITELVPHDEIPLGNYEPHARGGPLHLINVTLNETVAGRSQLEQKDRKGLGMAVGPSGVSVGTRHHALWSSPQSRGLRLEPVAAGKDAGQFRIFPDLPAGESYQVDSLDVGGWTALSGAAFTTGLGARTSLGTSLLLGLGNVRLGYWWDSGVRPRRRKHAARKLAFAGYVERILNVILPVQTHLLNEVLARFHGPSRRRWYLSDGGHSENTGAYELIRRRVPFIVICDDGRDDRYEFEDLANLVRRARTDFEAEVAFLTKDQLDEVFLTDEERERPAAEREAILAESRVRRQFGTLEDFEPDEKGLTRAHALLAYVYYQDPTRAHPPGSLLLVLKPSLTGDEPLDVRNYRALNPDFPQEPTTDQYFDEAQWESYRRLGEHIASRVFEPATSSGTGWRPADFRVPRSVAVPTRLAAAR